MHRGAQRAGVSPKLSQLKVLTLPILNLKQVIQPPPEGLGLICSPDGIPVGLFQTEYSFFTTDFCSLVLQCSRFLPFAPLSIDSVNLIFF